MQEKPWCFTSNALTARGWGYSMRGVMKDMDTTDAGIYVYSLKPKVGPIRIFAKKKPKDRRYEGILEFEARKASKKKQSSNE